MGATRNTGYLENLIQYDASDNVAIATSVNPSYKVTLGGSMLGTSATFSGDLLVKNTSTLARIDIEAPSANSKNIFFKSTGNADNSVRLAQNANTNDFIIATGDGTVTPTTRLTISSTGAATFSSSIAATSATFSAALSELNVISTGASNIGSITIQGGEGANAQLTLQADDADNASDITILRQADGGPFSIMTNNGGVNALQIAATTGAATFSSSVSIGGADQGYNLDVKRSSTGDSTFDTVANFYKASTNNTGLLIRLKNTIVDLAANNVTGGGGPTAGMSFSVSSGGSISTALTLASTSAATFSSSVTATSFTSTLSSGYNIVLNKGGGPAIQFNKTDATARSWEMSGGDAFYIYDGTASAYRFYINSSGNVGINDTNPYSISSGYKALTISDTNGGGIAMRAGSTLYGLIYAATNELYINSAGSSGTMLFYTAGAERMRITSGGNVGIGSTAPNALLTISGSATTYAGASNIHLYDVSASSSSRNWAIGNAIGGAGYGELGFIVSATQNGNPSGGTTILRLSATAATFSSSVTAASIQINAGTSAAFSFGVNQQSTFAFGSTNGKRVAIISDGGSADNGLQFGYDTTDNTGIIAGSATSAGTGIDFYTYNGSSWSNKMRITKGGTISQTCPTADWSFTINNTNTTNPYGLYVYHSGNDKNGTGNQFLYCVGGTTERASIRSNGGLANYSANNVNLASDIRLKKDITSLSSEWNKLKQLEVVNFKYKDSTDSTSLYGAIAQQVQTIYPELVIVTREATETEPEYYGIREQPFQWITTKVLQEAMAKIEILESELAILKNK